MVCPSIILGIGIQVTSFRSLTAFTVAWGSMAAQAARLVGLVVLVLELHFRRGTSLEFYCLCAALVVGLCK